MEQAVKNMCLFICHSFQMACKHWSGRNNQKEWYFLQVMTIHKTKEGRKWSTFEGLSDPFLCHRLRDYQVVQPKLSFFKKKGQNYLFGKIRDHVQYERAIMAVRFTDYFDGNTISSWSGSYKLCFPS
jgi:hypothetical protein